MDSIEIKGFKSIKNATIDLQPINILIGANGSGKSNFLSFFNFLNHLYNQSLNTYVDSKGGIERFFYNGFKETDKISAKISFSNGINKYSFDILSANNRVLIANEIAWYKKEFVGFTDNPGIISQNSPEAKIKTYPFERGDYLREFLNPYEAIRKFHFHDVGEKSPFSQMSHIENDMFILYEDGRNLAAFLYNIKEKYPLNYNFIVKSIQSIAPFFHDFFLTPNENGFLRIHWMDKYSSTIYGVNDFSDGTLRFIALATLFLQPNLPASIIIDEPELGLHPFAIFKLAGMMMSASKSNCQIIVATQSTDLISHFQPEDIITVDQINGESKFKRLDNESLTNWLEDYSIDDLWKRNIIEGGQPN